MRLLWTFLLLPFIEIALFVIIGGEIGVWATIGLVLLAAIAGVMLIRQQGMQAALELQQSLGGLRDPLQPMAHRTLLSIAGLLLILPGFLTDAVALLLLVPAVRNLILKRIAGGAKTVRFSYGFPHSKDGARDDGTIDGEYVIHDDPYLPNDSGDISDDHEGKSGGGGKSGWTRH